MNQETGEDLNPKRTSQLVGGEKDGDDGADARNPDRPSNLPEIELPDQDSTREKKRVQRITSPMRWEYQRMLAANVIDKSELPDFDEETGLLPQIDSDGMPYVICHLEI